MNFNWLIESIENPKVLLQSKVELQELKKRYPYLSSLHVFDAKLEQLESGLDYQEKIKKAAYFQQGLQTIRQLSFSYLDLSFHDKNAAEVAPEESTPSVNPAKAQETKLDIVPEQPLSQKEKEEKRTLEKEILSHAISASILKESVEHPELKKETKSEKPEVSEKEHLEAVNIELDNSMNVLAWLNVSSGKGTAQPNALKTSIPKAHKSHLIEKFITQGEEKIHLSKEVTPTLLQLRRPQTEFFSPENMAKMSLAENEDFVTETLAKIYAQQGNFKRAISAYEKLSLKFPEKNDYFARLIQELKEN